MNKLIVKKAAVLAADLGHALGVLNVHQIGVTDLAHETVGIHLLEADFVDALEFCGNVLAVRSRRAVAGGALQAFTVVTLNDEAGVGINHVEVADGLADATTHALGQWTDFSTWGTGWGNYGSPFANVQFRRWGDIVYVRGLAKCISGTYGTALCQLPYSFTYQHIITAIGNFGGTQRELRVDVLTNGQISIASAGAAPASGQWISLEFQVPIY